ncbi:hypothetical protein ElyMa_005996900 [Elysia marginata]|uniref:Uncharacterized protein n=1 Tax=Elysia marginata TaxID=1093978 RepID=A0AAV4GGB3_9GAST|nr:hypothetical protein ElyMa_005996900 [Elysia marginata]
MQRAEDTGPTPRIAPSSSSDVHLSQLTCQAMSRADINSRHCCTHLEMHVSARVPQLSLADLSSVSSLTEHGSSESLVRAQTSSSETSHSTTALCLSRCEAAAAAVVAATTTTVTTTATANNTQMLVVMA